MNERGSALMMACMALWIGVSVLAGIVALTASEYRAAVAGVRSTQVKYIAEAGIYRAIAKLNEDPDWREGFRSIPFAGGTYTVSVEDEATKRGNDDVYSVPKPVSRKPETGVDDSPEKKPGIVRLHAEGRILPQARAVVEAAYHVSEKTIVSWKEL